MNTSHWHGKGVCMMMMSFICSFKNSFLFLEEQIKDIIIKNESVNVSEGCGHDHQCICERVLMIVLDYTGPAGGDVRSAKQSSSRSASSLTASRHRQCATTTWQGGSRWDGGEVRNMTCERARSTRTDEPAKLLASPDWLAAGSDKLGQRLRRAILAEDGETVRLRKRHGRRLAAVSSERFFEQFQPEASAPVAHQVQQRQMNSESRIWKGWRWRTLPKLSKRTHGVPRIKSCSTVMRKTGRGSISRPH